MLVEKSFDTGEVVLNYAEGPDNGPPLVLIHGFPRWWNDFKPIIPELSKSYHVYALDLRGHGKSGRADLYTFSDYKRDIIQLIENCVNQPAILLGHSMGGWLSLMIASTHPHHVKAIIICDSPLNLAHFKPRLIELSDWWKTRKEHASKTLKLLKTEIDTESALRLSQLDPNIFDLWITVSTDPSTFGKLLSGYDIMKILEAISKVDCPVLLIQGNTKGMADNDIDYAMSVLSKVCHVYLDNHGHYLGLDTGDVADLRGALIPFLESLR